MLKKISSQKSETTSDLDKVIKISSGLELFCLLYKTYLNIKSKIYYQQQPLIKLQVNLENSRQVRTILKGFLIS